MINVKSLIELHVNSKLVDSLTNIIFSSCDFTCTSNASWLEKNQAQHLCLITLHKYMEHFMLLSLIISHKCIGLRKRCGKLQS